MYPFIIISGPSGVGKNTLADSVIVQYPQLDYFRKIATRDRRPDDRDAEADFVTEEQYQTILANHGMAVPYTLRSNKYGFPLNSFAGLKIGPRLACLGNFGLVRSLREAFDTTTVYVKAPLDVIISRLEGRADTPDQKQKSIDAGARHLLDYETHRDLYDYEITNIDLITAQDELLEIVKEEVLPHRRMYNFVLPRGGSSHGEAQQELDDWHSGDTALPAFNDMTKKLEEAMTPFYTGRSFKPISYSYTHGPVALTFYTRRDRERTDVSFGSLELQGPKKSLVQTGELLLRLFPELEPYGYTQVRMEE